MNSGCELIVWQCMYAGDVFDPATAALIGTHYDETMMMTTMDINPTNFKPFDIESDDLAGPYGAHGIGEPCVTNVSAVINAIFNATGKWVDPRGGPITPDIVLNALGKANIATSLLSR
jgi:CO/xanthine dehydrogenase Mo-binding subunit